ncbi:hypothetical protein GO485_07275 [Pseudoduganella flava]|nr:hypothetical protein GO485_07275 [Pseudoduganella flava]
MPHAALEVLTRRLADTPPDFAAPPRIGVEGTLYVAALVNDVAGGLGTRLSVDALQRLAADGNAEYLAVVALLAWLLADDCFAAAQPEQARLLTLIGPTALELAAATRARQFAADPERREELVRMTLATLGWRPAGETAEQAADRLAAISGIERRRLLEASRAAEQRARAIREALARQAAEEAADKWSRE